MQSVLYFFNYQYPGWVVNRQKKPCVWLGFLSNGYENKLLPILLNDQSIAV